MPLMRFQIDEGSIANINKQFLEIQKNLQRTADSNYINLKINADDFNKNITTANNSIKDMSSSTRSFASEIGNVIKRSLEWSLCLIGIKNTIDIIKGGFSEIASLSKENVNISMITGKSVKDIEAMNQGWLNTAKSLGILNSEVMAGAESWMRSGISIDEANKNLETTSKLAKIAGEDNKSMADSLIVIKNSYKLNSEELEGYASKVSLLDNQSATSSEKINKAMMYSAETFKSMGVDMDTALSWITNFSEKSSMSGEAIGRNFRSMMLNFHKVQDDVKNGNKEETDAVNKLELLLASKNIKLRESKDKWRDLGSVIKDIQQNINKFNQVELSNVAFKIGGKEQAEYALSTLNNMKRIDELNQKLKDDSGAKALNDSYKKYIDSIEYRTNNLKNSITQFYENTISSNFIKNVVSGLNSVVTTLDYLVNSNKKAGIALLALSTSLILVVKNASTVEGIFAQLNIVFSSFTIIASKVGVITALSEGFNILATSVKAVTLALLTNPLTYVVAAIGVATAAIISHVHHQRELKEQTDNLTQSYKNLTTALKENNIESMKAETENLKKQQDNLQKLIQQRAELEEKIKNVIPEVKGKNSLQNLESELNSVDKSISEQEKVLKDAGVAYDSVTGKIDVLTKAEFQLKNNEIVEKIKQEADAESKNKEMIIGLIQEYQQLDAIENKNSVQKERMSQLSKELSNDISGLKTQTDKYGNTTIQNTGLLGKEITILNTEGGTVKTLANVKLTAAKNNAQAQVGETKMTYQEICKRIDMYAAESKAITDLYNQQGNLDKAIYGKQQKTWDFKTNSWHYADPLSQFLNNDIKQYNDEYKTLVDAKTTLDEIYNTGSTNSTDFGNDSSSPSSGYMPTSSSDSSKSKSSKTTYTMEANEIDDYSVSLDRINDSLTTQDGQISSLNDKITYYKSLTTSDAQQKALETENQLLDQQKAKLTSLEENNTQDKGLLGLMGTMEEDFRKDFKSDQYGLGSLSEDDFKAIENKLFPTKTFVSEAEKNAYEARKKAFEQWVQDYTKVRTQVRGLSDEITKTQIDIANTTKDISEINKTISEAIEKQTESAVEKSVYGGQTQQQWEDQNNIKIKGLQDQLDIMQKQDEQLEKQNTLQDEYNKLIEDEKKLTEVNSEKIVHEYTGQGETGWEWEADPKAVKEAQDTLQDDQKTYNKTVRDNARKAQEDEISDQINALQEEAETRSNTLNRMNDIVKDAFGSGENPSPNSLLGIISTSLTTMNDLTSGKFKDLIKSIQDNLTLSIPTAYSNASSSNASSSSSDSITVNTDIDKQMLLAKHPELNVTVQKGAGATGKDRYETLKMNEKILGYANGGETELTGLHWLDGESGKPERVLSATQTESFDKLVKFAPNLVTLGENIAKYMYRPITSMPELTRTVNNNTNTDKGTTNNIYIDQVVTPNVDNFVSQLKNKIKYD